MLRKLKYRCFLLPVLLVFVACSSNTMYHENKMVSNTVWNADSVLTFQFDVSDTVSLYDINISTRNLEAYPYSNIWLFVKITAPDLSVVSDTIDYQLAETSGKWIGTGTGGVYSNQFAFRKNIYFPLTGSYTIDIQHGMRNTSLKGISDIGLSVEKNN
jgi:gliding motility-associated lipoprotein GldH